MATRVENVAKLKAKIASMSAAVRSATKQALAENADELVEMQKRLAPVKTGALRDSIVQTWGGGKVAYSTVGGSSGSIASEALAGDPDLSVQVSAGNTKVRYAHLVEFGTAPHINGGKFKGTQNPGTKAQPFFFPAYRSLKKRAKSRIARATKAAIKREAGG